MAACSACPSRSRKGGNFSPFQLEKKVSATACPWIPKAESCSRMGLRPPASSRPSILGVGPAAVEHQLPHLLVTVPPIHYTFANLNATRSSKGHDGGRRVLWKIRVHLEGLCMLPYWMKSIRRRRKLVFMTALSLYWCNMYISFEFGPLGFQISGNSSKSPSNNRRQLLSHSVAL